MKQWSVFDKKGGFTLQLVQKEDGFHYIRLQQFDFQQKPNNKRLAMKVDEAEASSIADQINVNLKNIQQWKKISIVHSYKNENNQDVVTYFNINQWIPKNNPQDIKLLISMNRSDLRLSTMIQPYALRFLAKVLNYFALESLEQPEKSYNKNNNNNGSQPYPYPNKQVTF